MDWSFNMKLTSENIIKLLLRVVKVGLATNRRGDDYLKQDIWDMIEDLKVLQFTIEKVERC